MATSNYQLCDNCNAKTIYIGEDPSTRFLIFCNDECCLAYAAKRVVQQTTDVEPATVFIGLAAGNGRHPDGTRLFVIRVGGIHGTIDGETEEEWRKDPMMIYAARQLAPRPLRFVDVGTLTWSFEHGWKSGNYFPPDKFL